MRPGSVFLPHPVGSFPAPGRAPLPTEETMKLSEAFKAPAKLYEATQNATVIAVVALIVAVVALFAATHRKAA
jgi:hypothetical protein